MMRAFFQRLRKAQDGAAILEFAMIVPVLFTLLLATLNLGIYFWAQNSLDNAIDEAARKAAIYPTPSDSELTSVFNNAILKSEADGVVNFNLSKGTAASGTLYLEMEAKYKVPVNLVFVDMGEIPVDAKRRIYVADPAP